MTQLKVVALLMTTFMALPASSQPVWQNSQFKVTLENNEIALFHGESRIVEITAFAFNFVEPKTIAVTSSQDDSLTLNLLFDEADGFHRDFPSELPLTISFVNGGFHFRASHPSFNHITIKLRDQDEHYFGLLEKLYPNNLKSPDLRGNVVDVEVYSYGSRDYAENYASAYSAFYMSSNGYGSFFDTFAKGRYHFAINGVTEIYHQTGALDWYVFYGPTGEKIHQHYFDVIGKPKYVPIWACGPMFWRDQNDGGKDEILDDIRRLTDLKIPLTACWVDRPFSDGAHEWSKMNFNEKFAEPEKWIKTITEKYGLEFLTWVGPMTFTDPDFPGRFPNHFGYLDLTNPDALQEFENRLREHQYSVGVKGHKMDRADQVFPIPMNWHEPVSENEVMNTYVYLYAKVIHNFLTRAHGRDQFNFARAAFHRTQPFLSAVWGGDSRSNWLGMAGSQANAIRCGFMGFPVWGNDTGGYLGEGRIDEKLYIRWLQWSAWNGMFEVKIDGSGGQGEDRAPWKYSAQLQDVYRKVSELRMELLPYIYSCANTSASNGVLMKPLAYSYPADANTYDIWDEYIFGNAFLVAPVFSDKDERDIYLPAGNWYDFARPGQVFAGPATINRHVPVDEIPVFIKENSIYVSGKIFAGNSKVWAGDLSGKEEFTIHLFPGQDGSQSTFVLLDYLDNDSEKKMVVERRAGATIFSAEPLTAPSTIAVRCDAKPKQVVLNGKPADTKYDGNAGIARIAIGKNTEVHLEIR